MVFVDDGDVPHVFALTPTSAVDYCDVVLGWALGGRAGHH
jgi:hypothetical protein